MPSRHHHHTPSQDPVQMAEAKAYCNIGDKLVRIQQYSAANDAYLKAVAACPNSGAGRDANFKIDSLASDDALHTSKPNVGWKYAARFWYEIGEVYFSICKYEEALSAFEEVLKRYTPSASDALSWNAYAWSWTGYLLHYYCLDEDRHTHRLDRVLSAYTRAQSQLNSDEAYLKSPEGHYLYLYLLREKAEIFKEQGHEEAAQACAKKADELSLMAKLRQTSN